MTNTNNYFVVPGYREAITPAPIPEGEDEGSFCHRKAMRILARKPLPVDWSRYFFFDDRDPISSLHAYEMAKRLSATPAVYKQVAIAGPWSHCPLLGTTSGHLN
jgi:hypothetical protein